MKKNILFFLLLSVVFNFGCNFTKNKKERGFYTVFSGWDIKHIPIIPPFRASSTYPKDWIITGGDMIHKGSNKLGSITLISFGVSKNYIYGETDEKKWFLFNTKNYIYAEYNTEKELTIAIDFLGLQKNKISSCEDYYVKLSEQKKCYWFPKGTAKYPTFEDYVPQKVNTIVIKDKDDVYDFYLENKLFKNSAKIYSFKIKNIPKDNDLYYISIDYSAPKLMNDSTIYSGASEYNDFINISVYTPFPVGEKKGIKEEDRLVLSRRIRLNEVPNN